MSIEEKKKIADEADMIISGYSYSYREGNVFVINLYNSDTHTMLMDTNGKMLESCMDPIEQEIAIDIWKNNKEFMEV